LDSDNARARFNMIAQQIRPWGVLDDTVLEAFETLPREAFVPDAYRGLAYADLAIPIGDSQVMLAPKVAGRMLQALAVRPGNKVLELGTGTGYGAACLALLGGQVIGLEIDPTLAGSAQARIAALGLGPAVEIRVADGLAGPTAGGPFDVVAVTGSVPEMRMLGILEAQLAPGGRLFCVVGEAPLMEAWRITRVAVTEFRREALFETCVPALANCPERESFVF
jgi:protein-L-isoaspartate(D-aspartate) O-methyltransferase